ncbi:MAG: deoxyribodipyrimidine photo-lyase [Proteobacteria bacterium]|nr:deoxyribodipyrimidine photo-lyase [Pseudomonadota bacterium]
MKPALVWFRQDLRLSDNPALAAAAASGRPVICIYVLDDQTASGWHLGGASRWWLHKSLQSLMRDLAESGGRLILRRGPAEEIIPKCVVETGAALVTWNRCYEPYAIARDTRLKAALIQQGVNVDSFNASLLFEPWTVRTAAGQPYRVFTPFWRALRAQPEPPRATPRANPQFGDFDERENLDDWKLLPTKPDWAGGLRDAWTPGEDGAQARLVQFLDRIDGYAEGRDRPDIEATSRLSPHLHFGEISPRQIWHAAHGSEKFLSEIAWREFAHHLLFHNPDLPEVPLDKRFDRFPWIDDDMALCAWRKGRTGIPIVDAGMRELWQTGWMHNRVRMIVASFLVKHLGIDWRKGEAWFWDTLVDADLANNAASWQWVAGCGADAAPFFRIFNPVLQGEKFDPDGAYVRRYVPEIATLPNRFLHKPWEAPANIRAAIKDYPAPIIDLKAGRERALAAFHSLKAP